VSYSSKDGRCAQRLVSALLLNGLSVWFDEFDVDVGEDIYAKIEHGIVGVDFVCGGANSELGRIGLGSGGAESGSAT